MHVHCEDSSLIKLPEDLTGSAIDAFQDRLAAALDDKAGVVLVDCAALNMCTSSHVGLLWHAFERCREVGTSLRVLNISDDIERVFRMLNLERFFLPSTGEMLSEEKPGSETELNRPPFHDSVRLSYGGVMDGLSKFMEYLEPLRISEVLAADLRLLYYEVAMNTKCHSGLTDEDIIDVSLSFSHDRFVFTFTDRGSEFDPTLAQETQTTTDMAMAGRTRGFGLRIVRALADSIRYERKNDHENILIIEKSWR